MSEYITVYIIADYGFGANQDDGAFTEVEQALRKQFGANTNFSRVAVPKFSYAATAFWIHQLGIKSPTGTTLIYHNTDARDKGEGASLVYALLPNTVQILGPNAQTCLALLPQTTILKTIEYDPSGSSFRSRDDFPELARMAVTDELVERTQNPFFSDEEVKIEQFPNINGQAVVLWVDGYGNIVLHRRISDFKDVKVGSHFRVSVLRGKERFGENPFATWVGGGHFSTEKGDLSIIQGTSGGRELDPFVELLVKCEVTDDLGASDVLGGVLPGDIVCYEPA